ncbi:2'-5' RNA ligase family protein [Nocardia neocaledoniensis]|uniref:2'-5' RNA ligase family protein n=1 Tax=Nocardia neocaledoniensis TaxID=236511 RepID=UPI0024589990|nr:2'-5' RNA ligase family protein [Nocardia neocaledoniensis]
MGTMIAGEMTVASRWWWRPGWTAGRSFYDWQVTPTQPVADKLVEIFAPTLSRLPGLEPVDAARLRVGVQGVGFVDGVKGVHLAALVDGSRTRLAGHAPFQVTFGPPVVAADSIRLPITAPAPLLAVREELTEALTDVWIRERVPEFGEPLKPYLALAHVRDPAPVDEVRAVFAADGFDDFALDDTVAALTLAELQCENGRYDFAEVSRADLLRVPEPVVERTVYDDPLFGDLRWPVAGLRG